MARYGGNLHACFYSENVEIQDIYIFTAEHLNYVEAFIIHCYEFALHLLMSLYKSMSPWLIDWKQRVEISIIWAFQCIENRFLNVL